MTMLQKIEQAPTRRYNISVMTYSQGGTITRQENCFAFMFTNIGDTIASVNGMVIYPSSTPTTGIGDSRTISGHTCDLYAGNIDLSFDVLAPGTNPSVEIVQLFYI